MWGKGTKMQGLSKAIYIRLVAFIALLLIEHVPLSPAWAVTVVNDHFNDGVLDPAWSITFQNATGWTFTESGTVLNVTDITPTDTTGALWATVILSQTFTPLTNFQVHADFSWDSEGSVNAAQNVSIQLFDSAGSRITSVFYHDPWTGHNGEKTAEVGGNVFVSGADSLPFMGSASINIARVGSNIDVLWDGVNLVSGTAAGPLGRIAVGFWFSACNCPPIGTSFFGNESVDLVWVEGTSTAPEPATLFLLGSGLAGLFGLKRKRLLKRA